VWAGIEAAERAGLAPIKVNCVVQRGVNDGDIVELARRFRGTGRVLRFIEFMDVGTRNGWNLEQVVTAREIVERIGAELPLEPLEPAYRGEVARRWRYRDGAGEIGVIASVSQPFCGDCTRARLSADGRLVTCLFATGGVDLKGPLRAGASDAELRERIAGTWAARSDRYSELRSAETAGRDARAKLEMYQLGG
jgi:cyclic pyranopterin phosphate synthase